MKNFIITNRPIYRRSGIEFINRSNSTFTTQNLRFAAVDMDTMRVEVMPEVPSNEDGKYLPTDYSNLHTKDNLFGSELWFKQLYEEMAAHDTRNDTLFFIHGFQCGFDCFMDIMEDLHEIYVKDDQCSIQRIVGFSWPSNDKLTQYFRDQDDALMSGIALSRGYKKLLQFFDQFFASKAHPHCESNIHLLCHSMGNQVFESMFKHLKLNGTYMVPIFKEIVLAAPDIDYDVFEKGESLNDINKIGERVHAYFHRSDDALKISQLTKNKMSRLGLNGPRNAFAVPTNVHFIDASDIKDAQGTRERLFDHWYYKRSGTIIDDMKGIFNGRHTESSEFGRTFLPHKNMYRLDVV